MSLVWASMPSSPQPVLGFNFLLMLFILSFGVKLPVPCSACPPLCVKLVPPISSPEPNSLLSLLSLQKRFALPLLISPGFSSLELWCFANTVLADPANLPDSSRVMHSSPHLCVCVCAFQTLQVQRRKTFCETLFSFLPAVQSFPWNFKVLWSLEVASLTGMNLFNASCLILPLHPPCEAG